MGDLADEDFEEPREHDDLWRSIVDGLRRQGWSRWDAYAEAEDRISRIHDKETE